MPETLTVQLEGPAALRALARAFGQFEDFERFVQGLQKALDRSAMFEQATLAIDRGMAEARASTASFSGDALTVPVAGSSRKFGTLQASLGRQFGAADLHLLAGLADFLAAVLSASTRLQEATRSQEMLRFLLNQSPVGVAAFGADRKLIVANDLALRWLGENLPPFDEVAAGGGGFHLRNGGKLIFGEARSAAAAGQPSGWLVVLHDLTPEQAQVLELMKREVWRGLASNERVGLALVESAHLREGALMRLPALRAKLHKHEAAGPYDAHRVALVFPGLGGLALRARLRKLRTLFGDVADLRLGYAELGREARTPEELLQSALERVAKYDELLRPALLVQDENPGVADTLAMVLGREYRVVKSDSPARTRELLNRESFEGLITELEPRNGPTGAELARLAREWQPGIRSFLTTMHPETLPVADAILVEKPFDVAALTALVRDRVANC